MTPREFKNLGKIVLFLLIMLFVVMPFLFNVQDFVSDTADGQETSDSRFQNLIKQGVVPFWVGIFKKYGVWALLAVFAIFSLFEAEDLL